MYFNFKKIPVFIFLVLFVFLSSRLVFSKTIDEEINDVTKQIADLEAAIAPLKTESTDLQKKITSAKSQITKVESQVTTLNKNLADKEVDLQVQQKLLGERVKRYYKNSKKFSPLLIFLAS